MLRRLLPVTALLAAVALPLVARADDKKAAQVEKAAAKADGPGLVVRIQSVEQLLENARYLAALVGREEEAKQMEGFLKAKAGPKGLEGIDMKRPMGLYANIGPNGLDSTAVALIPIADQKAFLGMLDNTGVKYEKKEGGLFEVKLDNEQIPVPIHFRFANKHVYVAVGGEDVIDPKKLLDPAVVLPEGPRETASITFRIDRLPDGLRQVAIAQIEQQMAAAKERKDIPDETKAQEALRHAVLDEMSQRIIGLLQDGKTLALRLDVDRRAEEITLDLALAAKPGSTLAKDITALKGASVVGGVVGPDAVMSLGLTMTLPERVRKALVPVIDEGIAKALKDEKDPAKKAQAERMLKAVRPTLEAASYDLSMSMSGPGPDNLYGMVVGLKVKDGGELDKALRQAVADLPADQRKDVTLDALKVGDVEVHQAIMKNQDKGYTESFGNAPAFFAVRPDALFLTLGQNSQEAMKKALAVPPVTRGPAKIEVSLGRLAPIMARQTGDNAETARRAPEAAKKAFGTPPKNDKVWIALEPAEELRLRVGLKAHVLQFFHFLEPESK